MTSQSAGINVQSSQSATTPRRLTLDLPSFFLLHRHGITHNGKAFVCGSIPKCECLPHLVVIQFSSYNLKYKKSSHVIFVNRYILQNILRCFTYNWNLYNLVFLTLNHPETKNKQPTAKYKILKKLGHSGLFLFQFATSIFFIKSTYGIWFLVVG